MMEALTALGLASNIVQFVQFGAALISESNEIYSSFAGTTKELDNLEDMCHFVGDLSASFNPSSPSGSCSVSPDPKLTKAENDLVYLAQKCEEATNALHTGLEGLKCNSNSRGRGASFRQALKNWLGKSHVHKLAKTVKSCRSDLMLCLIAITSQKQSSIVKYLEKLQRADLHLIHDHSAQVKRMTELAADIKEQATKITNCRDGDTMVLLQSLNQQLKAITATSDREWILEDSIVRHLDYESLHVRRESIAEAHANTFSWMLDSRLTKRKGVPSITLLKWLKHENGLYWISGKPGSGKSTLMKFITNHPLTQAALDEWAGSECITAEYYFWSAGTRLQKSIEGLLRSLLFDLFTRRPELIQVAVPDRWVRMSVQPANRLDSQTSIKPRPWTISEMTDALQRLASNESVTQRFCFFIDGLDEYYGNHREVVDLIEKLSNGKNLKLCVSSRPWNVFEDRLGLDRSRKIYIHELTRNDIHEYISSVLQTDSSWKVGVATDSRYKILNRTIVERAQGVFLWVVLVVRSLLEGLADGDSIQLLTRRIEQIPNELGPFFRQILSSIPSLYHQRMALYFRAALDAPQALTLMHYSFLDQCFESEAYAFEAPIQPMDNHDIFSRHSTMRRRLNARCKGLLEHHLIPSESKAYLSHQVTFLHRTVRDFFQTEEMIQFLQDILGDYPVNSTILLAQLGFLKALPASGSANPMMEQTFIYANRAEKESPDQAIACIDEICRVAIEKEYFLDSSTEIAYMTVAYGLCGYVSASIKEGIPDYEDVPKLLDWAIQNSTSQNLEHSDMLEMVQMLAKAGARLSNDAWAAYIRNLAQVIQKAKNNLEIVSQHQKIFGIILDLVDDINHPSTPGVAWEPLLETAIPNQKQLIPKYIISNTNLFEMLLAQGADPNLNDNGSTVWSRLCERIRTEYIQEGQSTYQKKNLKALSELLEALIYAGADVHHPQTLSRDEINQIFTRPLAKRILTAIEQQSLKQRNAGPVTWTAWALSFLWRKEAIGY